MKKLLVIILIIALVLSLAACGGNRGGGSATADNDVPATEESSGGGGGGGGSITFKTPSDMLDEQTRLYSFHEAAFEDDPFLALAVYLTGATFTFTWAQLLNLYNEDGKFGDANSSAGFYEQNGSKITIGKDFIAEDDGFYYSAGDRLIENGQADLSAGWIWLEESIESGGQPLRFQRTDQQFKKGFMAALVQMGIDEKEAWDGARQRNTGLFVIYTEDYIEYVTGSTDEGQGPTASLMKFDANMSAAEAKAMFESNGLTIERYGRIQDGKVTDLL